MPSFQTPTFLRTVLAVDASASLATGLLLAAGGPTLASLTGLPTTLLFASGLTLFPFVAYVAFLATRARLTPAAVWTVVGINVLWVVDSFALLASGSVHPTALGAAFVVAQALAVAGLAAGEFIGLRRGTVSLAAVR
jgi:hypothetical protein